MDVNIYNMLKEELTFDHVFGTIVPAWYHVVFRDPKLEKLALERGEICRTCEHLNHFVKHRKFGKKCGLCGCPIISLVRSESSKCKAGKW
jgi:hypothetical protein